MKQDDGKAPPNRLAYPSEGWNESAAAGQFLGRMGGRMLAGMELTELESAHVELRFLMLGGYGAAAELLILADMTIFAWACDPLHQYAKLPLRALLTRPSLCGHGWFKSEDWEQRLKSEVRQQILTGPIAGLLPAMKEFGTSLLRAAAALPPHVHLLDDSLDSLAPAVIEAPFRVLQALDPNWVKRRGAAKARHDVGELLKALHE